MAESFMRYARRMIRLASYRRMTLRQAMDEIKPLRKEKSND